MIYYIIFIILTFIVAYVNNKVSKKIFYPPIYLCFIWILFVFLHLLFIVFLKHKPTMLSSLVLIYFFVVIFLFSLGGLIAKGVYRNVKTQVKRMTFSNKFLATIILLNLYFLGVFIYKIKEITGNNFDLLLFKISLPKNKGKESFISKRNSTY